MCLRDKVYKVFIEVREVFLLFIGLGGLNGGVGLGKRKPFERKREKIKERQKKLHFFLSVYVFRAKPSDIAMT